MPKKYEFERSKQDIADAVLRQAGEFHKGFIECIQNSYDSMLGKPKKIPIEIEVLDDETVMIKDSGKGFKTIEDFRLFGRDDSKGIGKGKENLGEFHIGRGQIFAMANVKDDGTRDIVYYTNLKRKKIKIFNIRLLSNDVSFEVEEENHQHDGTTIIIKNPKFDYYSIKEYLKKTVGYFPRQITLNGVQINENPTKENTNTKWVLDTPFAKIFYTNTSGGFELYNLGLSVRNYLIASGFSGYIFTKQNLKLDRARTSVMDDDVVWGHIKTHIRTQAIERVLDFKKPTNSQKEMMIRMAGKDEGIYEHCKDKKIIPLSNGKYITPRDLEMVNEVYISKKSHSRQEDKAIQSGYVVLEGNGLVKEFLERREVNTKKFTDCPIRKSRYVEIKEENYSKIQREILEELSYFCDEIKIYWGKSKGTMAWTDGKKEIHFNPDNFKLERWNEGKEIQLMWNLVETLAHELSHDDDTLLTDEHGEEFDNGNVRNLERLGVKYSKWIAKRIKQKIKEESGEKFTSRVIRNKDIEGNLIVKIQIPKEIEDKHKLLKKKELELSFIGSTKY